jgi:hypothetical protein
MAREAGLLTWLKPPEDVIERFKAFEALVRADERALAAPVQEPVGYLFQHEETGLTTVVDVQQVEWGFEKNNPRHQKIGPVYTTPPVAQRQWVEMSDARIKGIFSYHGQFASGKDLPMLRVIEAMLKENK